MEEEDRYFLRVAAAGNCDEAMKLIGKNLMLLDIQDQTDPTYLIISANEGHFEHIDPNDLQINSFQPQHRNVERNIASNAVGLTALMRAVVGRHIPLIEKLLAAGANINIKCFITGLTALILAAQMGSVEVVRILIEGGAELNSSLCGYHPSRATALSRTAFLSHYGYEGHAEVARELLRAGADQFMTVYEAGFHTRQSLLISAARDGFLDHMKWLVNVGMDVNIQDASGETALMQLLPTFCCTNPKLRILEYLISAGAEVNISDNMGRTPLMLAARCKGISLVSTLLKAGAKPNTIAKDGSSALHFACARGRRASALLLVKVGCDPWKEDDTGSRPVDILREGRTRNFMKCLWERRLAVNVSVYGSSKRIIDNENDFKSHAICRLRSFDRLLWLYVLEFLCPHIMSTNSNRIQENIDHDLFSEDSVQEEDELDFQEGKSWDDDLDNSDFSGEDYLSDDDMDVGVIENEHVNDTDIVDDESFLDILMEV